MFSIDLDKKELRENGEVIDPCIVHFPGARMKRRMWLRRLSVSMPVEIDSKKITIVTYSTYRNSPPIVNQFQSNKQRFVLIGERGEAFHPIDKLHRICDCIKNIDTEYFISLDSFYKKPSEVFVNYMNLYEPLGCKILFNAEVAHYPPCTPTKNDEKIMANRHRFCFLNSGVYIANTEFFSRTIADKKDQMMEDCKDVIAKHWGSDQMIFKMFYVKHHPSIMVNSDCKIFLTVPKRHDIELIEGGRTIRI